MEIVQSDARSAGEAFLQAAQSGLNAGLHKIRHCVGQLTDQQVWSRERPEMNSIANIVLHLTGNLRQWIISGVGGSPDVRNRPAEFSDRSMKSKSELLKSLEGVIEQCNEVLAHTDPAALTEMRRIQGFDVQLLAAIFDTVAHLKGHAQEIIYITRLLLSDAYVFDFVPKTPEQGA